MREDIEKRALEIGHYIVAKGATVRQTASVFRVSKSTVHKDVTERLPDIDHSLAEDVRRVLNINKAERHIRGGMATKEKYLHEK
ncbi:MAG: sporulation transcriptional regulator SpoIIID [Lachnospiraceae bacterium]|nr:sporulation transcriptional regulator SpoIIID [Lachnospiraceae bacterium]